MSLKFCKYLLETDCFNIALVVFFFILHSPTSNGYNVKKRERVREKMGKIFLDGRICSLNSYMCAVSFFRLYKYSFVIKFFLYINRSMV